MEKSEYKTFEKSVKSILDFMYANGENVKPYPKIKLNNSEQNGLFIKTGYYSPEDKEVVIFTNNRHIKDCLRSAAHEFIHHSQNLDGVDLNFSSEDDVKDDERLEEIESEAYLKGNVYFRKWTEYAKKDSKDVLQEGRKKVVKNDKGEIVPEKCDKCGGDVVCQIHGEPVYICKECGKYFGTRPFNLKENRKKKEIFITEAQYRHLLSENEGTNMKRARKYLEAKGYSPEERQEILDSLRTDIPNSRLQQCKFLLGVTRLYMEGQLKDGNSISQLNKALKYIASDAHVNEYDYNLNGENLDTLVERFSGVAKTDLEQSKTASNARHLTPNKDYAIVPINNPKEAAKYGKYTSWCVTHYPDMYDSYTANGTGRFYFCLRRGFENEPKIEGEGCPLDSYGLSMIAVSVTMEGEVNTITCRWNHDNGGNDNIMTIEQLEDLLGRNFYQTFKPYTREELHARGIILFDEVQGLLDSGKKPEEIFAYMGYFREEFAQVRLNDKYNFINTEGKLLSNQWFDVVSNFHEGFAVVKLNDKENFINTEGKLISNQWFSGAGNFYEGFAVVKLNYKYNFINTEGKLISNQWFDEVGNFQDGFAEVKLNGKWYEINKWDLNDKYNFINTEGKLISNQWFDWVNNFQEGFAQVRLNHKYNFINTEGKLISNQWFDGAGNFHEGFAVVKLNGKWYEIDKRNLYDKNTNKMVLANASALNEGFDVTKALQNLKKRRDPANIENWDTINEEGTIDPIIKNGININIDENDWVSMILNHEKTIETRPLSAANMWKKHIGETIGLVRTTKNRKDTTGMLVGSAKLVDVVEYMDAESFAADVNKHRVSGEYQVPRCGLVLDDVKEIKPWVKLKPKGQQQVRPIEPYDSINESADRDGIIDLSSFNIKTALNPKFWKDEHLDSRIRIRLLDIADDFIEFLGVNWVKPEDVIMTGSLANYNWNKKYSDIDLHILMDFSKVDKRTDFVKDYFDSKKNLWNESHKGLSICGFPVELYVQDSNEKHSSTGVYSLNKNEWITEPNRASLKNSKINKALIKNKVSEFMDKIDKIDDIYKSAGNDSYKARKASEMAEKLWAEIKAQRKEGLSDAKNEITNGNIIYKTLRRTGYLDKIFSLRDKSYDKVNSLDESQD